MDEARRPEKLGRSLRLHEGDLEFVEGRLVLVSGRDNLVQGLRIALETPPGSDVFNVGYGFDLVAASNFKAPPGFDLRAIVRESRSFAVVRELIRLHLVQTLNQDDRVREVQSVTFEEIESKERGWKATVVLSTSADGELALALSGPGI